MAYIKYSKKKEEVIFYLYLALLIFLAIGWYFMQDLVNRWDWQLDDIEKQTKQMRLENALLYEQLLNGESFRYIYQEAKKQGLLFTTGGQGSLGERPFALYMPEGRTKSSRQPNLKTR